jgi:hypothetical protein
MISDRQFDQMQHTINVLQEDNERLNARVAALEQGKVLPPDQTIQLEPPTFPVIGTQPDAKSDAGVEVAPEVQVKLNEFMDKLEDTELDLLSGGGLTAGGRRA